ncbi:HNH endonuclease [Streptomyces noursei]|uniref:HNH endonuclease n=1 Tax=Streptomyces noursei TaxID=1971 RepID=UPI00227D9019|nr:HNH endonuclease [Streptomyces noursei]MCZ1019427.1 HNH endonuclease [Streptomyces noursei]
MSAVQRAKKYLDAAQPEQGCLVHPGHKGDRGYITVRFRGRNEKAHRFIYRNLVQELNPGDVVHHKCANRSCINPDHLQAVTAGESTAEMLERNFYLQEISKKDAEIEHLRELLAA